jgi:hypothetical protein
MIGLWYYDARQLSVELMVGFEGGAGGGEIIILSSDYMEIGRI